MIRSYREFFLSLINKRSLILIGIGLWKYSWFIILTVAETLVRSNPQMTFIYVSGSGTVSSEKGSLMWARVKGKTEND